MFNLLYLLFINIQLNADIAYVCNNVTIFEEKSKKFQLTKNIISIEEFDSLTKEARVTVYDDKSLNKGKEIVGLNFDKDVITTHGERMISCMSEKKKC